MAEQREAKKDCFGYSKEHNRCVVLNETHCKYEECGYYKKRGTLCDGCPGKKEKGRADCKACKIARKGL